MTFDKWSTTTWSLTEDLDSITAYDFPAVSGAVNLYAHFAKTEVKIYNSFVKCDVTGTENTASGVAFRMANVTVTGFEKGNDSIKSIMLNLLNVERVYFYNTSGKTYKQGQNANLTAVSGGCYSTQSAVVVTFNNKVSMATAQDYLRNNVVIKPIVNQDVEVKLTVSDGVISMSDTTTVTQGAWGGTTWKVFNGSYNTTQLTDACAYFTGNTTFTGNDSVGALKISGTCYIYIPSGVTVTCNGKAGSAKTGGGAGVYLPSGATLYVYGGGTLNANGGKAGNGSNGGNAANATSTITIAWEDEADFETNLERIITQKWIAMYPDGCEGWAEFRRTGYPSLFPVVNNDSQGLIDTQIQVRRCPFPVQEYNTNEAAVQAAIQLLDGEALGGGQDNGGTRLWWDRRVISD